MEQDLKLGTVPLFFPWTKVNEELLCREKKTENFQNDSVVVSLPTLGKWVEEIKMENERLLYDESQECKAKAVVVENKQLIDHAKSDDVHLPFQQFLFISILIYMAAFYQYFS